MGGMLVNVFVRSDDQAAVVQAAKEVLGARYAEDPMQNVKQKLQALLPGNLEVVLGDIFTQMGRGQGGDPEAVLFLVSPSLNGWVGVHDSLMQNQDESLCSGTAMELSDRLHTTAISFLVHDGDVLCYWLARDGAEIDEYNSMPDYFGEGPSGSPPSGGDAELLAEACGVPAKRAELAALLTDPPAGDAIAQLERLGEALGIVDAAVDYDLLTYSPPRQIGFSVPEFDPGIVQRDQYVTIRKKDLNP